MKRLTPIPERDLQPIDGADFISKPGGIPLDDRTLADMSWMAITNGLISLTNPATAAANKAVSWRDYKIGAAAYAFDQERNRLGVITGFNIKPDAGNDGTNIHAEQMVVEKARYHGFTFIGGIAIWGEPQADDLTGIFPDTVHPCALCRAGLHEAHEVTDRTAIMSTNTNFTVCEMYNVPEITEHHANNGNPPLTRLTVAGQAPGHSADLMLEGENLITVMNKWVQFNPDVPYAQKLLQWHDAGQPTG